MKKKLNVAIIGYGGRGKKVHQAALELRNELEIVAICNRSQISLSEEMAKNIEYFNRIIKTYF